jgi:hypothetical protein
MDLIEQWTGRSPQRASRSPLEVLGIAAAVLLTLSAVAGVAMAAKSMPEIRRYLRVKQM